MTRRGLLPCAPRRRASARRRAVSGALGWRLAGGLGAAQKGLVQRSCDRARWHPVCARPTPLGARAPGSRQFQLLCVDVASLQAQCRALKAPREAPRGNRGPRPHCSRSAQPQCRSSRERKRPRRRRSECEPREWRRAAGSGARSAQRGAPCHRTALAPCAAQPLPPAAPKPSALLPPPRSERITKTRAKSEYKLVRRPGVALPLRAPLRPPLRPLSKPARKHEHGTQCTL